MHDLSDWNRLDDAAFRVSIRRSVRRLARYEVAIGVIAVICGFRAPLMALIVVGAVLFSAGLWNLCRTSIEGMIVDGIAVILTGVFSASTWMWMDDARATGIARGIFVGAMQIVWGVRRIAFHRTARRAVNDTDAIARLEVIIRDLAKRNAKTDPGVIEFRTGPLGRHRNRIGLYSEGAIGLLEGQAVRLERRGDIWIEAQGTGVRSHVIKVRIQMSDLQLDGRMAAEYFQRFEHWKLGMWRPGPIAA